jgi:hypothetical protein
MGIRYTEAFIEQALFKVYSRGERTVKSVAVELNINHYTLKKAMSQLAVETVLFFQEIR